jgi:hypothetical protein
MLETFADHVKRAPHKSVHADLHEETIVEGAYEDSEGHLDKADKAQRNKDMFSHHMHMADHHDSSISMARFERSFICS